MEEVKNLPTKFQGMHGRVLLKAILEEKTINWGNYKFLEATHQPIPTISKESEVYREAVALVQHYNKYLIPCEAAELANELYILQGHHWQKDMPLDLMKAVANDYARLLQGYSLPVVSKACDEWKLSKKNFFPQIGELKEILDSKKAKVGMKIKRLTELLDNAK